MKTVDTYEQKEVRHQLCLYLSVCSLQHFIHFGFALKPQRWHLWLLIFLSQMPLQLFPVKTLVMRTSSAKGHPLPSVTWHTCLHLTEVTPSFPPPLSNPPKKQMHRNSWACFTRTTLPRFYKICWGKPLHFRWLWEQRLKRKSLHLYQISSLLSSSHPPTGLVSPEYLHPAVVRESR